MAGRAGEKPQKEEYDWLEDPFDEEKIAKEREETRMSGGTKVAVGCSIAIVAAALLVVIGFFLLLGAF